MKTYYLARKNDAEAFAVFETEDGFLKRIYPHTQDSKNYSEIELLISANDANIVYCEMSFAESLLWSPPLPKTTEQLLEDVRLKRASEYPPITDYIDGVVKGDQAQIQAYIDACLAVKAKYPKP